MNSTTTSGVKRKTCALPVEKPSPTPDWTEDEAGAILAQLDAVLFRQDLKADQKCHEMAALVGTTSVVVLSQAQMLRKLEYAVWQKTDGHCTYCAVKLNPFDRTAPDGYQMDHVHPFSRGGTTDVDNLVPACGRCNWNKYARTPEEWRATRV